MTPPSPYGYRLSLLLAWGETEQADMLLLALNAVQRTFGHPDYTMPEPATTGLPDLVSCDATGLTPSAEQLSDPLLKHERRAA